MKKVEKLHLLEISEEPWQEISINIIGPLPKSNDKDIIVVIVDWFTKMIRLKVTIIIVLSEDITKIYSDKICTWNTTKNSQWQKILIHLMIHRRLWKSIGDKMDTIYSIPSSNRQSNGKNQSRSQSVLVILYLPTK